MVLNSIRADTNTHIPTSQTKEIGRHVPGLKMIASKISCYNFSCQYFQTVIVIITTCFNTTSWRNVVPQNS